MSVAATRICEIQSLGCRGCGCSFFFNDTATTEIYTLSLHDALPIWTCAAGEPGLHAWAGPSRARSRRRRSRSPWRRPRRRRSEEHTSELQSLAYLVCRLLLAKKKILRQPHHSLCHSFPLLCQQYMIV